MIRKTLLILLLALLPFLYVGDAAVQSTSKDHSRVVSLGLYVGVSSQGLSTETLDLIAQTPFNFLSIHGLSPWSNVAGRYPWKYDQLTHEYQLNQWDEVYWQKVRSLLTEAAKRGIGIEWCFFDSYGDVKWRQYPGYPAKRHPFVENNLHETIDARTLYADELDTLKPLSPFGRAMIRYVDRFAYEATIVRNAYPVRFYLYVRPANEPSTRIDRPDASVRLNDHLQEYIKAKFESLGFVSGPHFRVVNNDSSRMVVDGKLQNCYECDLKGYRWLVGQGYLYEVHGIEDVQTLGNYKQVLGNLFFAIPSSDGAREDDSYFERMRQIEATKPKRFDYKMVSYDGKWRIGDMDWNIQHSLLEMVKRIWQ